MFSCFCMCFSVVFLMSDFWFVVGVSLVELIMVCMKKV